MSKIKKLLTKKKAYTKAFEYTKKFGPKWAFDFTRDKKLPDYVDYYDWYEINKPNAQQIQDQQRKRFVYSPKISIIIVANGFKSDYLEQTIKSVKEQTYNNWEIVISVFKQDQQKIENILNKVDIQDRLNVFYANNKSNITDLFNNALSSVSGEYVAFLGQNDLMPCNALFEVVDNLQQTQRCIIYSDEDKISNDLENVHSPLFKPDWSPYLLECHNYINHLFVVKSSFLNGIEMASSNFYDVVYYDMILFCTEQGQDILHIPKILYHVRDVDKKNANQENSIKEEKKESIDILKNHFNRKGVIADIDKTEQDNYFHPIYLPKDNPLVSIIVLNISDEAGLTRCIDSLANTNKYLNYEIIVVNVCSDNAYINLNLAAKSNIKAEDCSECTSIAAAYNKASNLANGEYLLFLDSNLELLTPNGISEMLGFCIQSKVAAVGAKIITEDKKIEHAGIVIGLKNKEGNVFKNKKLSEDAPLNRTNINYDCSAVSAKCMMVKKHIFDEFNSFFTPLGNKFFGIDYCLKAISQKYSIVCNNFTSWKQNVTSNNTPARFCKSPYYYDEEDVFSIIWSASIKNGDPYYNLNLDDNNSPYSIKHARPISYHIDSCNFIQNDNGNSAIIEGWAVSNLSRKLKFSLLDSNNTLLRSRINFINRPDLYYQDVASTKENSAGFKIICDKFIKLDGAKLIISDNTSTEVINLKKFAAESPDPVYQKWFLENRVSTEELLIQKETKFKQEPLLSIIVPLYKTPEQYLLELVESIKNQSYKNWQLCLSDGSGKNSPLSGILEKLEGGDSRIKTIFSKESLQISDNTNLGLSIAKGDFIIFGDHDDIFEPNAFYEIVKAINENTDVDLIYTDEDKIDETSKYYFQPHFKPDFNIDFLRSGNYFCHIVAVKKELLTQVGNLNSEYDGAQDYDYVLRCVDKAELICHIPKILYHWRICPGSTAGNPDEKKYAFIAGAKALQAHLDRNHISATASRTENPGIYHVKYQMRPKVKLHIVITNYVSSYIFEELEKVFEDLMLDDLVIDVFNEKQEIYSTSPKNCLGVHINYLNVSENKKIKTFNEICNKTNCDYILCLDSNMCGLTCELIEELLGIICREDVAVVGTKIIDINHNVINSGIGFGQQFQSIFYFMSEDSTKPCYTGRAIVKQDVTAIDPRFFIADVANFNDNGCLNSLYKFKASVIDYCFRCGKLDYSIVVCPEYPLIASDRFSLHKTFGIIDSQAQKSMITENEIKLSFYDSSYNKNITDTISGFTGISY